MEPSLLTNVKTGSGQQKNMAGEVDMDDPVTVSGSLPVNCSTGGMRSCYLATRGF